MVLFFYKGRISDSGVVLLVHHYPPAFIPNKPVWKVWSVADRTELQDLGDEKPQKKEELIRDCEMCADSIGVAD